MLDITKAIGTTKKVRKARGTTIKITCLIFPCRECGAEILVPSWHLKKHKGFCTECWKRHPYSNGRKNAISVYPTRKRSTPKKHRSKPIFRRVYGVLVYKRLLLLWF